MTEHEVSRTLVKSPPELWSECSDPTSLARHLGEFFGEIRITRLEPETAVAWEGELASGTVRLEPSGWGTKVILTAQPESIVEPEPPPAAEPEQAAVAEPEPEPPPEPEPHPVAVAEPEPAVVPKPEPAPDPTPAPQPPKRGFFKRIRAMFAAEPTAESNILLTPVAEDEPLPVAEEEPPPVAEEEPPPVATPEPAAVAMPEPRAEAIPEPPPEPAPPAQPEPHIVPEPAEITIADDRPPPPPDPASALTAALDSLGQAHHRPFSRS